VEQTFNWPLKDVFISLVISCFGALEESTSGERVSRTFQLIIGTEKKGCLSVKSEGKKSGKVERKMI
jgi:hypothetical protein